MAGPVWTGALKIGLLTVPVALYKATESHAVRFRRLERDSAGRVRNRRVNEHTGAEVPLGDLVKGYEVTEGEYVVVEPGELEQAAPERSRIIDISGFVDLTEIDPVHFDRTYYLGPRGEEHARVYRLLATALARLNRAGLGMLSMYGREHLTAVRSVGGLLELHTMYFADEVRDPHREVDHLPTGGQEVDSRELRTAEQLIDVLTLAWNPADYRDGHQEQIRRLVHAKLTGRESELLRRSVESIGRASGAGAAASRAGDTAGTTALTGAGQAAKELSRLTRDQLYRRAVELDIPRRSTMNRDQLRDAVTDRLDNAP